MATLLDFGILDYFVPIFVFMLVFGILFALLEKTSIFGKNKGLNGLISFVVAFLFILTSDLVNFVRFFTPWVVMLFIFLVMIILLFMFVGVKAEAIAGVFSDRGMVWIIILLFLTIFIYAMTQVYGESVHSIYGGESAEDQGSGLSQAIGKILFHPKMLGVAVMLFIAAQTVRLIAGRLS